MKKLKKYISIFLTLQLMLVSMLIPGVLAADELDIQSGTLSFVRQLAQEYGVSNTESDTQLDGEPIPMAANDCEDECEHDWEYFSREDYYCPCGCGGVGNKVTLYCTKCYLIESTVERVCHGKN